VEVQRNFQAIDFSEGPAEVVGVCVETNREDIEIGEEPNAMHRGNVDIMLKHGAKSSQKVLI